MIGVHGIAANRQPVLIAVFVGAVAAGLWTATHSVEVFPYDCGTVFTQDNFGRCDGALSAYTIGLTAAGATALLALAALARSRPLQHGLIAGVAMIVLATSSWFVWRWASPPEGPIETVHWTSSDAIGGRTIRLGYPMQDYHTPSCWTPVPFVHYRSTQVGIVLRFEQVQRFCTAEGGVGQVDVRLDEDLGDRDVVDDAP